MGNSLSSISQCSGLYPSMPSTIHLQLHLERTLQLHHLYGVNSTWEATDTGYKPSLNWHRVWYQGLLLMVGEIFVSHWTATTCLKLGSPQSVRCCPAMSAFFIGCMEIRRTSDKQIINYCTRQQQKKNVKKETSSKTGMLECPDNDAQPFPGPPGHQHCQENSCHQ